MSERDDTKMIQALLDSGEPVVLNDRYGDTVFRIERPLIVPAAQQGETAERKTEP